MKIYSNVSESDLSKLTLRPQLDQGDLRSTIEQVFLGVKKGGDEYLKEMTLKYDHVNIDTISVPLEKASACAQALDSVLKTAILAAKANIENFHRHQLPQGIQVETMPGVVCSQKPVAIQRVGIYIPGGTAPLFSTILMLAIPAQIAGCSEIVLCSPPTHNGEIHPVILATAHLCGIKEILQIGGSQAIAALSIGTSSVKKVSKIFGPGNQYVTAAKQHAQKYGVAIDMPAGPSEVLVYADDTCVPSFVAADLLSQAEHGLDSQVVAVVSNEKIANDINEALQQQLPTLPRMQYATGALANSFIIVEPNIDRAFQYINDYAPEHFIIASDLATELAERVINAGSVFLGNYCPEAVGDYASGTNHTLPTYGWAASYSGVNVDAYMRKITFQTVSRAGLENLAKIVVPMAEAELLQAHANAVTIRLKQN